MHRSRHRHFPLCSGQSRQWRVVGQPSRKKGTPRISHRRPSDPAPPLLPLPTLSCETQRKQRRRRGPEVDETGLKSRPPCASQVADHLARSKVSRVSFAVVSGTDWALRVCTPSFSGSSDISLRGPNLSFDRSREYALFQQTISPLVFLPHGTVKTLKASTHR